MLSQLSSEDLFEKVVVFGNAGSDPALSPLLPILRSLLGRDAGCLEKRACAVILDITGNWVQPMKALMADIGRTDDLLLIGQHGDAWVNPLIGQSTESLQVAKRIIELASRLLRLGEQDTSGDSVGHNESQQILRLAVILSRARHWGEMDEVSRIADALEFISHVLDEIARFNDGKHADVGESDLFFEARTMIQLAKGYGAISAPDEKFALEFLDHADEDLSALNWSAVLRHARSHLADVASCRVLTPSGGWTFSADEILDLGRVVVVAAGATHSNPEAALLYSLIKSSFQTSALERRNRIHFDGRETRPVNCKRPVYFVSDEFPVSAGNVGNEFFVLRGGRS